MLRTPDPSDHHDIRATAPLLNNLSPSRFDSKSAPRFLIPRLFPPGLDPFFSPNGNRVEEEVRHTGARMG